jgi:hypothetical protein
LHTTRKSPSSPPRSSRNKNHIHIHDDDDNNDDNNNNNTIHDDDNGNNHIHKNYNNIHKNNNRHEKYKNQNRMSSRKSRKSTSTSTSSYNKNRRSSPTRIPTNSTHARSSPTGSSDHARSSPRRSYQQQQYNNNVNNISQSSQSSQSQSQSTTSRFVGSTRKSAIQDVIKKFQCPDSTSIPTTFIMKSTRACGSSSSGGESIHRHDKKNMNKNGSSSRISSGGTCSSGGSSKKDERGIIHEHLSSVKKQGHGYTQHHQQQQHHHHHQQHDEVVQKSNFKEYHHHHHRSHTNSNNNNNNNNNNNSGDDNNNNNNNGDDNDNDHVHDHVHFDDEKEGKEEESNSKSWSSILDITKDYNYENHQQQQQHDNHRHPNRHYDSSKKSSTKSSSSSSSRPTSSPLKELFTSKTSSLKACQMAPPSTARKSKDKKNNNDSSFSSSSLLFNVNKACPFGSSSNENIIITGSSVSGAGGTHDGTSAGGGGGNVLKNSFTKSQQQQQPQYRSRQLEDDESAIQQSFPKDEIESVFRPKSYDLDDCNDIDRNAATNGNGNHYRRHDEKVDEDNQQQHHSKHHNDGVGTSNSSDNKHRHHHHHSTTTSNKKVAVNSVRKTIRFASPENVRERIHEEDKQQQDELDENDFAIKKTLYENEDANHYYDHEKNSQPTSPSRNYSKCSSEKRLSPSSPSSSSIISRQSKVSLSSSATRNSKSPQRNGSTVSSGTGTSGNSHRRRRSKSKSPRRSRLSTNSNGGLNLLDQSMDAQNNSSEKLSQVSSSSPSSSYISSPPIPTTTTTTTNITFTPEMQQRKSSASLVDNENDMGGHIMVTPDGQKNSSTISSTPRISIKVSPEHDNDPDEEHEYRDKAKSYVEQWTSRQSKSNSYPASDAGERKSDISFKQLSEISVKSLVISEHSKQSYDNKSYDNSEVRDGEAGMTAREKTSYETDIKSLKAQLREKDALLTKQTLKNQEEKEMNSKAESHLKSIIEMLKNEKSIQSKEISKNAIVKLDFERTREEVVIYKEQLQENDEYIKALEKAMDEQLKLWDQEEERAQTDIEEKSELIARFEMREKELQQQLLDRKQQLMDAKLLMKETNNLKNSLVLEQKKVKEMEVAAKMNEVKTQRKISQLQNERDVVEVELASLKTIADESFVLGKDREAEITRLQEEIKHAEFRVQVLKGELKVASPIRSRRSDSSVAEELNISITDLEVELSLAKKQAKEAFDAKDLIQEKYKLLQSRMKIRHSEGNIEQHSGLSTHEKDHLHEEVESLEEKLLLLKQERDQLRKDMGQLEQKLFEARSRSRRIAVKSEVEMAQMRSTEKTAKASAQKFEVQVKKLEDQLSQIKANHKEESIDRKRIENALRNELIILRNEDSSSDKTINHAINVDQALLNLNVAMNHLSNTMGDIGSAKNRISKDSIKKLGNEVEQVKINITKVEASVEENKVLVERARQGDEDSIKSYQAKNDQLEEKMKAVNEELHKCQGVTNDETNQTKQLELDLISKNNALKGRYSLLHEEFNVFKIKANIDKKEADEMETWLMDEIKRLEKSAGSSQTNTSVNLNDVKERRKVTLSLQHGITRDDVEVRLKDDDRLSGTSARNNNDESKNEMNKLEELPAGDDEMKLERASYEKYSKNDDSKRKNEGVIAGSTIESGGFDGSFDGSSDGSSDGLSDELPADEQSSIRFEDSIGFSKDDTPQSYFSEEIVTSVDNFDAATQKSV